MNEGTNMRYDRTRTPAAKARTCTRRVERRRKAVAAFLLLAFAPDAAPFATTPANAR